MAFRNLMGRWRETVHQLRADRPKAQICLKPSVPGRLFSKARSLVSDAVVMRDSVSRSRNTFRGKRRAEPERRTLHGRRNAMATTASASRPKSTYEIDVED